jgi:hypothetical protein
MGDNGRHPVAIYSSGRFRIHADGQVRELVAVLLEDVPLPGDKLLDSFDLSTPDRSLHVCHLVLETDYLRPELSRFVCGPAMIGQQEDPVEELGI